jgi:hypothetical protein
MKPETITASTTAMPKVMRRILLNLAFFLLARSICSGVGCGGISLGWIVRPQRVQDVALVEIG